MYMDGVLLPMPFAITVMIWQRGQLIYTGHIQKAYIHIDNKQVNIVIVVKVHDSRTRKHDTTSQIYHNAQAQISLDILILLLGFRRYKKIQVTFQVM